MHGINRLCFNLKSYQIKDEIQDCLRKNCLSKKEELEYSRNLASTIEFMNIKLASILKMSLKDKVS
jgi:hypothetical protein